MNDKETAKSMFHDETGLRWLITGDQGVMDEEGYVTIVGRIKDIIIRGGENLFPVVIENKTLLLPGVADCSFVPSLSHASHPLTPPFPESSQYPIRSWEKSQASSSSAKSPLSDSR